MNRRDVFKAAGAVLAAGGLAGAQAAPAGSPRPVVCLFSKPLSGRAFGELPAMLNELGVGAVDLTCRPGGHVLPERVADDLPRAVERLKAAGVAVPMISTAVTDAGKDHAEAIVKTAASLGIRYAKLGYYHYTDRAGVLQALAEVKAKLRDLAALFKSHGVTAGYHNHSGRYVGAPTWDLWQAIADLPPEAIGAYFDLGHATVEGGAGGWQTAIDLLGPRIIMLAIKDMKWVKAGESWKPAWGPLGEGMVPFKAALARMARLRFSGPVSLHVEYGPHGAPAGSPGEKETLTNIRRDWSYLRERLTEAGF
ncbi:MAG: sugar phosphate isomerase/epimerase [Phycisphaerae bacterium]